MLFFLQERISAPLLLRLLSLSDVGSLFFGKKAKENKKKSQKFNTQRKKKRETTAHTLSFFPSLSVLHDINTHARETREDYKSNFFVSSLEELSEVKKKNALGR